MPTFNYTLPSGNKYELNSKDEITQVQADKIFYDQLAAGSLVGYTRGQTLAAPETIYSQYGISRLDRGIAGVNDTVILATLNNLPAVSRGPDLTNVPIVNPITQADLSSVTEGLGPSAIGALDATDVQATMAAIVNFVDQDFDIISSDKGVGKYGFSCDSLERAGYVKPGTKIKYDVTDENLIEVLSSPSVWTGKNGVYSLEDYLNDVNVQNKTQEELLDQAYTTLVADGTIVPPVEAVGYANPGYVYENSAVVTQANSAINLDIIGGIGMVAAMASKFGPLVASAWAKSGDFLKGLSFDGISNFEFNLDNINISEKLGNLVDGAIDKVTGAGKAALDQFAKGIDGAISFAQNQIGGLVSNVKRAAGFVATIDRSTVDAAFGRIIDNAKIPLPKFGELNPPSLASLADMEFAKKVVGSATNIGLAYADAKTGGLISKSTGAAADLVTAFNKMSTKVPTDTTKNTG